MSLFDSILRPIVGGNTDAEDKAARDSMRRATGAYNDVAIPDLEDLILESYQWNEDLNLPGKIHAPNIAAEKDVAFKGVDPRLADVATMDRSAFEDISVDPRLKDSQSEALAALEELASSGGLTGQDRAVLSQIQSDVASADKGRRDAILQNSQARGMGGGGMELLAQLQSNQAATDRASQRGMDVTGLAQQRALDALIQSGSMAGQMRGQEFSEDASVAASKDAIDRFNAQYMNQANQWNANTANQANQFNASNDLASQQFNRNQATDAARFNASNNINAQQFNAQAANQAALYNNQGRQMTSNLNTDTANTQRTYNTTVKPQANFNNEMAKASGKAGAYTGNAQFNTMLGDRKAVEAGNKFGALSGLGAAGIMAMSDERKKKNIQEIDASEIEEFLQAVTPKKFQYKSPKEDSQPEGDRLGFMLQDVENTALGEKLVKEDENGVKHYDRDNLDGIILAALSTFAKGKN